MQTNLTEKCCNTCKVQMPVEAFQVNRRNKDGLDNRCRFCTFAKMTARFANPEIRAARTARRRVRDAANIENKRQKAAAWRDANREKLKVYSKTAEIKRRPQKIKSYYENRELHKKRAREWGLKNKDKVARAASERRARLAQRRPAWLTADDLRAIAEMYENAAALTVLMGEPWHVDHILPLKGKYVSGLHVPSNLQLMPGVDNLRKNNHWIPE